MQEQNRNIESIPHNDGIVFRFVDSEPDWKTAWRSNDAENDLKAIEKRPSLYKGFTSLRPFVGLWTSFQKGTLHRYKSLRCDDELIRYLDRIKHVWASMLDGDEELTYNLDPETAELFEVRAPKTSSADKEFITEAIESKRAFPLLYDGAKRLRLLQNVVAVDGVILSIKTLAKDSLYLEDCAKAMRTLIDPIDCQVRDEMQRMWHGYGGDYILLENANGLTKYGDMQMDNEEEFQIAYVQMCMLAMRDFHRLTSVIPKSDNKQKVLSIGPDPQCLLEFARLANALGFRSNAITSSLNADADREHAKNMLTIARPPAKYDYDLETEITGHCQLLTGINDRQQEILKLPVWTTTLSDVKIKQRYGRPHSRALQDCAPYFFLHNIYEIPESGKYITDLFVKRSIALSFFRLPQISPEAIRYGNRMEGVGVDGRSRSQQLSDHNQTYQAKSQSQTSVPVRNETQDAADTSQLEECRRQVVEQQRENLLLQYKVIEELETINLDQSRKNSQAHLELVENLRQSQQKIETLERKIADHESVREMQVLQAKHYQDQQQMAVELKKCHLVIAEFESGISKYKSESDRQESAAQQLTAYSQRVTTELEALRSIIVQWERGDLQRAEDINNKGMFQVYQERIAELERASQQQDESLRNSKP
ncbi:9af29918-80fd-47c1-9331-5f0aad3ba491 [Sclerotinia trifoliorum]|uniref:9af29918-80fd-47c1-9331-5f0aad3ba491 n=1 Tax=Sclerotinia trifoliorum TaxID=28548 RepID=A0A8H2ZR82_9HELO|nr:9af29918-80fd-47c1-9331-5f0aad3ba491 [Sclerotinia trifoliorum]